MAAIVLGVYAIGLGGCQHGGASSHTMVSLTAPADLLHVHAH